MPMTDPLGDMLTRIRNGQQARKDSILTPASNFVPMCSMCFSAKAISAAMPKKACWPEGPAHRAQIFRGPARDPAFGSRVEAGPPRLFGRARAARIRNGLGITIVSTPRGVLSDAEARDQNVGGEVLAEVF